MGFKIGKRAKSGMFRGTFHEPALESVIAKLDNEIIYLNKMALLDKDIERIEAEIKINQAMIDILSGLNTATGTMDEFEDYNG